MFWWCYNYTCSTDFLVKCIRLCTCIMEVVEVECYVGTSREETVRLTTIEEWH